MPAFDGGTLKGVRAFMHHVAAAPLPTEPRLRSVLGALATYYPDIHPSRETLAVTLGVSVSTARNRLRELEARGLIETRRKGRGVPASRKIHHDRLYGVQSLEGQPACPSGGSATPPERQPRAAREKGNLPAHEVEVKTKSLLRTTSSCEPEAYPRDGVVGKVVDALAATGRPIDLAAVQAAIRSHGRGARHVLAVARQLAAEVEGGALVPGNLATAFATRLRTTPSARHEARAAP